jgi:hypothetical protein
METGASRKIGILLRVPQGHVEISGVEDGVTEASPDGV